MICTQVDGILGIKILPLPKKIKIGDLIFTGTPAGVSPVAINDRLTGYIEDKMMFDFLVK